ncbi:MAG: transcription termination/antitermination factor NusG [Candidatus Fischerbacteria bacterium RBG_13_37_8]|uniref:Transcription termination/antitermination protein NusG n=1 Tax=Candidatus Fischerbacteria bacterium RBG_13_37_8 TaxID=1817863 RepID=A0A1F5V967_9BACT|nr:MAG: transcription termination/antitermination factor NusG [Candidatus Fischerbacteria bacterium RBG_13_37_8]
MSMKWYVLHTYSGQEEKAIEALKKRLQAYDLLDKLGQALIPVQQVMEAKAGKKVTMDKKLFPGYIIVEMEMDDKIWNIIRGTAGVSGFISAGKKPLPLSDEEVMSIMHQIEVAQDKVSSQVAFEKGDKVRITDGPFFSFTGYIDEVNPVKNTLKVMVTIFGRATPVELSFYQVEKIM